MAQRLVVAVTGATGMLAAKRLIEKTTFAEVVLVVSEWGKRVYERECGALDDLGCRVAGVYDNADLSAPIASGSVDTLGMVIIPCSANTLGQIAAGTGDGLIARAAHCHLKERKRLVLAFRETPLSLIDINNARTVTLAGGVVMPMSPPFFMAGDADPNTVTMVALIDVYVDRVLKLFGVPPARTWEDVR